MALLASGKFWKENLQNSNKSAKLDDLLADLK